MPDSYIAVDERLSEEEGRTRPGGKTLLLFAIPLALFGTVVIRNEMNRQQVATPTEINALALPSLRQPAKTSRSMQPMQALPLQQSVQAAKDKLSQYGVPSSPLADLAIKAVALNYRANTFRDVSAAAMAEEKKEVGEAMPETVKKVALTAKDLPGITGPLGFFDPLGFTTNCPEGKLLFYREVELKHGRVGMLASLGIFVGEQFHPLFGGNIDVPSYVAFQQTPLQTFWPAVLTAIAIPEAFSVFSFNEMDKGMWTIKSGRTPGDLGFDPLGMKPTDGKELLEMQNKELNNGRLAMLAAAGMIAQELATGQKLFGAPASPF